jgi:hypothetical protein
MTVVSNWLVRTPRLRDALLLFILCLLAASLFCSGSHSVASANAVPSEEMVV